MDWRWWSKKAVRGISVASYPYGSVRGPLFYYKRPGIVRLQPWRRGVLITWWWK